MYISAGRLLFAHGYPRGGVQIPEYSASRSPQAREWECKTASKALIMSPRRVARADVV